MQVAFRFVLLQDLGYIMVAVKGTAYQFEKDGLKCKPEGY